MKILVKGSNFPSAGFIYFLHKYYEIDFQEIPEYKNDFYYPFLNDNRGNMVNIFNEYFEYDRKACEKGKNNVKFICSRKKYVSRMIEKYNIKQVENANESKYDYIFESATPMEIARSYYYEGHLEEKRIIMTNFFDNFKFLYTPHGTFFTVNDQSALYGRASSLRRVLTYNLDFPSVRIEKNRIYYSPSPFSDLFPGYVLGLLSASYISSAALHYSCPSFKNYLF